MEKLKAFVERYQKIPASDWEKIAVCFHRKVISKNQNLLEEGEVCNSLCFLENGLLRFFTLKDGVEITKFFTVAPYFFTSQASFNSRRPANEYIQTIEDSVLWEISFEENEELMKIPSWNSFARKIIQEVQFLTEEILEELQTETAESRYTKLQNEQPELLQRIPLKYLASFYGVAPQSLSRIRKNVIKKSTKLT